MYPRELKLEPYVGKKSVFLLGPRQTGKSTLLKKTFPAATYIDLLESETFRELSRYPEQLRQRAKSDLTIIDEVQKLPGLLDEVQRLIDRDKSRRFILTGSSARKLRRGAANLLGGRALFFSLHPLTSSELGFERITDQLNIGSLPGIIDSSIAWDELKAYVGGYLREEVQAEGLTRSIENFSRFLDFSSHLNGEQVNYTKVGNDAGIAPRTVKDYFSILVDTLLAFTLPPYQKGKSRKAVSTEKFYLFDIGVANVLLGRRAIAKHTPDYGKALEHLIFLELKAYLDYRRSDSPLHYWRTKSQIEVDFLLAESIAIEVKGSGRASRQDCKSLLALGEETKLRRKILVCTETHRRVEEGVEIIPVGEFLKELWGDALEVDLPKK